MYYRGIINEDWIKAKNPDVELDFDEARRVEFENYNSAINLNLSSKSVSESNLMWDFVYPLMKAGVHPSQWNAIAVFISRNFKPNEE